MWLVPFWKKGLALRRTDARTHRRTDSHDHRARWSRNDRDEVCALFVLRRKIDSPVIARAQRRGDPYPGAPTGGAAELARLRGNPLALDCAAIPLSASSSPLPPVGEAGCARLPRKMVQRDHFHLLRRSLACCRREVRLSAHQRGTDSHDHRVRWSRNDRDEVCALFPAENENLARGVVQYDHDDIGEELEERGIAAQTVNSKVHDEHIEETREDAAGKKCPRLV